MGKLVADMTPEELEQRREYARRYREENREQVLAGKRRYRKENREQELARHRRYHKENREKVLAGQRRYREENRELLLARHRRYHKENREQVLAKQRQWRQENPEKEAAKGAKYRAYKGRACPKWLTDFDHAVIRQLYQWAQRCEVQHHVDHEAPLNGRTVEGYRFSGLHVPWNLALIPASENLWKSDRFAGNGAKYPAGDSGLPKLSAA